MLISLEGHSLYTGERTSTLIGDYHVKWPRDNVFSVAVACLLEGYKKLLRVCNLVAMLVNIEGKFRNKQPNSMHLRRGRTSTRPPFL